MPFPHAHATAPLRPRADACIEQKTQRPCGPTVCVGIEPKSCSLKLMHAPLDSGNRSGRRTAPPPPPLFSGVYAAQVPDVASPPPYPPLKYTVPVQATWPRSASTCKVTRVKDSNIRVPFTVL